MDRNEDEQAAGATPAQEGVGGDLDGHAIEPLLRQLEEGFNRRDFSLIESLVAEHLLERSRLLGAMDLRQRLTRIFTAFPDARLSVERFLVAGGTVAARWTVSGTHQREILGVPPTGRRASLSGISVAVIVKGKAVEYWEFPDLASLIQELQAGSDS